jgi:ribosomal protein S18 acetylase RimI-like enzyme
VLRIRTATAADAAHVADIHVRAWQAAYRGLLPDEYLDGLRAEDRMARYRFDVTDPDQPATIVAIDDGVMCGFATMGPARDNAAPSTGELFALYVEPALWGRGVGRLLMAETRARLSRQGFVEGVLWVLVGNHRAQRFYQADGWMPDGSRRDQEVWGIIVDEVRYRSPLG